MPRPGGGPGAPGAPRLAAGPPARLQLPPSRRPGLRVPLGRGAQPPSRPARAGRRPGPRGAALSTPPARREPRAPLRPRAARWRPGSPPPGHFQWPASCWWESQEPGVSLLPQARAPFPRLVLVPHTRPPPNHAPFGRRGCCLPQIRDASVVTTHSSYWRPQGQASFKLPTPGYSLGLGLRLFSLTLGNSSSFCLPFRI